MAKFCAHEQHGGICSETGTYCNLGPCPYEDLQEYAPVRHGRWELVTIKFMAAQYGRVGYCQNCNEERLVDNFCPNCGAKMEVNDG